MTKIEWTEKTWNPIRGCTRISPGCVNCYAERMAARGLPGLNSPRTGEPFAIMTESGPRWTGDIETIEDKLNEPISWRKPSMVFVNSMSDLFHERLDYYAQWRIWFTMSRAKRHTFQVLTKRADVACDRLPRLADAFGGALQNVWLGFSAENQEYFDARWRYAKEWQRGSILFVSLEPLLGRVVLPDDFLATANVWVIVGGESGPGARPCSVDWVRDIVDQCRSAGVPVFVKQLGANPIVDGFPGPIVLRLKDRKGGNINEWAFDLQVRQTPLWGLND